MASRSEPPLAREKAARRGGLAVGPRGTPRDRLELESPSSGWPSQESSPSVPDLEEGEGGWRNGKGEKARLGSSQGKEAHEKRRLEYDKEMGRKGEGGYSYSAEYRNGSSRYLTGASDAAIRGESEEVGREEGQGKEWLREQGRQAALRSHHFPQTQVGTEGQANREGGKRVLRTKTWGATTPNGQPPEPLGMGGKRQKQAYGDVSPPSDLGYPEYSDQFQKLRRNTTFSSSFHSSNYAPERRWDPAAEEASMPSSASTPRFNLPEAGIGPVPANQTAEMNRGNQWQPEGVPAKQRAQDMAGRRLKHAGNRGEGEEERGVPGRLVTELSFKEQLEPNGDLEAINHTGQGTGYQEGGEESLKSNGGAALPGGGFDQGLSLPPRQARPSRHSLSSELHCIPEDPRPLPDLSTEGYVRSSTTGHRNVKEGQRGQGEGEGEGELTRSKTSGTLKKEGRGGYREEEEHKSAKGKGREEGPAVTGSGGRRAGPEGKGPPGMVQYRGSAVGTKVRGHERHSSKGSRTSSTGFDPRNDAALGMRENRDPARSRPPLMHPGPELVYPQQYENTEQVYLRQYGRYNSMGVAPDVEDRRGHFPLRTFSAQPMIGHQGEGSAARQQDFSRREAVHPESQWNLATASKSLTRESRKLERSMDRDEDSQNGQGQGESRLRWEGEEQGGVQRRQSLRRTMSRDSADSYEEEERHQGEDWNRYRDMDPEGGGLSRSSSRANGGGSTGHREQQGRGEEDLYPSPLLRSNTGGHLSRASHDSADPSRWGGRKGSRGVGPSRGSRLVCESAEVPSEAKIGGELLVRFYLWNDSFDEASGDVHLVASLEWETEGGTRGHTEVKEFVVPMDPGERMPADVQLSVPDSAAAYSMATLRADIMVGKRKTSSRQQAVRMVPPYQSSMGGSHFVELVLITDERLERGEYMAWRSMCALLGLHHTCWDIPLQGGLLPSDPSSAPQDSEGEVAPPAPPLGSLSWLGQHSVLLLPHVPPQQGMLPVLQQVLPQAVAAAGGMVAAEGIAVLIAGLSPKELATQMVQASRMVRTVDIMTAVGKGQNVQCFRPGVAWEAKSLQEAKKLKINLQASFPEYRHYLSLEPPLTSGAAPQLKQSRGPLPSLFRVCAVPHSGLALPPSDTLLPAVTIGPTFRGGDTGQPGYREGGGGGTATPGSVVVKGQGSKGEGLWVVGSRQGSGVGDEEEEEPDAVRNLEDTRRTGAGGGASRRRSGSMEKPGSSRRQGSHGSMRGQVKPSRSMPELVVGNFSPPGTGRERSKSQLRQRGAKAEESLGGLLGAFRRSLGLGKGRGKGPGGVPPIPLPPQRSKRGTPPHGPSTGQPLPAVRGRAGAEMSRLSSLADSVSSSVSKVSGVSQVSRVSGLQQSLSLRRALAAAALGESTPPMRREGEGEGTQENPAGEQGQETPPLGVALQGGRGPVSFSAPFALTPLGVSENVLEAEFVESTPGSKGEDRLKDEGKWEQEEDEEGAEGVSDALNARLKSWERSNGKEHELKASYGRSPANEDLLRNRKSSSVRSPQKLTNSRSMHRQSPMEDTGTWDNPWEFGTTTFKSAVEGENGAHTPLELTRNLTEPANRTKKGSRRRGSTKYSMPLSVLGTTGSSGVPSILDGHVPRILPLDGPGKPYGASVVALLMALPMREKVGVLFTHMGRPEKLVPSFEGYVGTEPKRISLFWVVAAALHQDLRLDLNSGWQDLPHASALLDELERRRKVAQGRGTGGAPGASGRGLGGATGRHWPPTQECSDALALGLVLMKGESQLSAGQKAVLTKLIQRLVLLLAPQRKLPDSSKAKQQVQQVLEVIPNWWALHKQAEDTMSLARDNFFS